MVRVGVSPPGERPSGPVAPGELLARRWRVAGVAAELPGGVLVNAVDDQLRKRVRVLVVDGPVAALPPHAGLAAPLAVEHAPGRTFVAFPFWDGAPLTLPERPIGPGAVRAFVAHAIGVLEVLEHVHRATGRAHGHLTLASFWRAPDGAWTLFDAGVPAEVDVRFSHPDDDPADPRSDVYALAAILHAIATGTVPFGTGDGAPIAHRVLRPSETDVLPLPVLEVLRTALQKAPHHRFSSAGRAIAAFQQALDALDGHASDPLHAPERVPVGDATLEPTPPRLVAPSWLSGRRSGRREPGGSSVLALAALGFLSVAAWTGLVGLCVAAARWL